MNIPIYNPNNIFIIENYFKYESLIQLTYKNIIKLSVLVNSGIPSIYFDISSTNQTLLDIDYITTYAYNYTFTYLECVLRNLKIVSESVGDIHSIYYQPVPDDIIREILMYIYSPQVLKINPDVFLFVFG